MNRKKQIERYPYSPFMRLTDIEAMLLIVRLMRRSTTRVAHRQSAPEAN
jgi:hypothetical protein